LQSNLLYYIALNERMICEWLITKDVGVSGHSLVWGTILSFAWRDWGKRRKNLVRIDGLQVEIWTRDLPNMKECWSLEHDVQSVYSNGGCTRVVCYFCIQVVCHCYIHSTFNMHHHTEKLCRQDEIPVLLWLTVSSGFTL
jgi:hypothetical protein